MSRGILSSVLAAAAALAGAAGAQTVGPDVIVGDLHQVSNYGAVGGIYAYSVGTISCNLGDERLTWVSGTNQHPVISQNMYKLVDGRFRQVGQAWLKHGFCALQGTVCGSCSPNPDGCPALGVGCSDPYDSGLNGSQGGLGPKSEVNASTGAFPYPYGLQGSGDATLKKRLQVKSVDLDTTNAQFFVSSMYVQPEDATRHNNNNNQSYRRINVNQSTKAISVADSTQRTRPAIFAWRDHGLGAGQADPDVVLTAVDVANDGRFWVAVKARDLGNGLWRYEYAIENLNSHRSGQSFTVPFPAGATIANVGFSDVDYHSGEVYSGTDWTVNNTGTSLVWSTQTFAQNANANALRWDTIYNFWFDCSVPPAGGTGTIGLFRTGTPSGVSFSTVTPSADGQFHPYNDSCANAADVSDGTIAFSSVNATTDGPDEPGACTIAGYTQIGSDIWYRYTASCTGTVTVRTCGSAYDTKIAVYNTCPTASGQYLACDDDGGACGVGSQATFTGTVGNSYLIRVGGYQNATGAGTLTIAGPGCGPQVPANDLCANSAWLSDNVAVTGNTALATNDGTANCGNSTTSPDVWYKYRPATTGTVTINTCTSGYDTVLSVYTGNCGAFTQRACNDDATAGPCNGTFQSYISMSMTAGTLYTIRVAGYNGATGAYRLIVNGGGGLAPPSNDDCANRGGISLGSNAYSTLGATTDGTANALCNANGFNQITNDVWYNYPSQCDGNLRISTCNSNFNSRVAVYSGAGCANLDARILACSDSAAGCGQGGSVTIPVTSGQNYTIRVGGTNGAVGTGELLLECLANCPADFNNDGFLDFFDLDAFVECFEGVACPPGQDADFNLDGFVDFFDLDGFVTAFEAGCP